MVSSICRRGILPAVFSATALLLLLLWRVSAEEPNSTINGYPCLNDTQRPCQTYVHYRAQAPSLLSLRNISDLFGTSRFEIALASNLSTLDSDLLSAGQELLIPVSCGCMRNYSQYNVTYQILGGNTFYLVSTVQFENLTTYQAVEVTNPTAIPTQLNIGDLIVFPIRCQCPTSAQIQKGIRMLITYVIQPSDTLSSISSKFGTKVQNLREFAGNSSSLVPFNTILVPVSKKPVVAQPPASSPRPAPTVNSSVNSTSEKKSYKGALIGVSVGESIALLICLGLLVFCYFSRPKRRLESEPVTAIQDPKSASKSKTKLIAGLSECIEKPFLYSFEEIQTATMNFSPDYCIQGSVYRGIINGKIYAIKLMKSEISEELKILQKVNHTNLVRLEGVCINPDGQSYLVYEYLENSSLNKWLHDRPSNSRPLNWRTRLQIALDIANGLQYIHEHTNPTVVHKDIKSSNILLDSRFRAKIANFGMAKSGLNALTKHIIGTQGYMAPEYLADGLVTPKLDVFSFGVVVLELISGKEAIVRRDGIPLAGREGLLWAQIKPILDTQDTDERLRMLKDWIDPDLQSGSFSLESVVTVAVLAKGCVEEIPGERPSLAEIVFRLSNALDACVSDDSFGVSMPVSAR
eukprot:TRINITY_DN4720_c0_g1_i1.p1 TRINITY_DN4720_c0_g1~~TRINITY_DN4720_c0_g1_i1.p1  ORF type:complete len:634 (-),score=-0.26 TRINITY_DN4720_c0_g1_i1:279-2180(-)